MIKLGTEKVLEQEDICPLPSEFRAKNIFDRIQKSWKVELEKSSFNVYQQTSNETGKNAPQFSRALWNSFCISYWISIVWFIPYVVVVLLQPFFISHLLEYIEIGSTNMAGITSGIGIALLLGIISIIAVICFNYGFAWSTYTAKSVRTAVITSVFAKSLRLSPVSKYHYTTGEIVTLMSVDAERLWQGKNIIQLRFPLA